MEIYMTRDTESGYVEIWNPNIGIIKQRRNRTCVRFVSAKTLEHRGVHKITIGRLSFAHHVTNMKEINKQFGFTPPHGTAWIVNTTTLKRTRIDEDMDLII